LPSFSEGQQQSIIHIVLIQTEEVKKVDCTQWN